MEKSNKILILLGIFLISVISLRIFQPNTYYNLTGFLVDGGGFLENNLIFYIIGFVIIAIIIFLIVKFFIGVSQLKLGIRPVEAMESLILDFEMAKSKGDKGTAIKIGSRISKLYEHLLEDQKPFFKDRVGEIGDYINKNKK